MFSKKMDRREFLKIVMASAAAAGLSHFRFLNFGGVLPVLADGCGHPAGILDTCNDMMVDYCNPGEDYDVCPDPNGGASSSDVCVPEQGEMDECAPPSEPDICDPADSEPDICDPAAGLPDQCEVPPGGPDTCFPQPPSTADICPDGGETAGGDGDICSVTGENDNPDECIPAVNEPDLCSTDTGTDFCRNPDSGIVEPDNCDPDPDICYEGGQNVVDICDPDNGDPDTDPNVLQLTNFNARSDMTTLGAVAALGAAALLRPRKENDPSE
jgi:hypothetical protein